MRIKTAEKQGEHEYKSKSCRLKNEKQSMNENGEKKDKGGELKVERVLYNTGLRTVISTLCVLPAHVSNTINKQNE